MCHHMKWVNGQWRLWQKLLSVCSRGNKISQSGRALNVLLSSQQYPHAYLTVYNFLNIAKIVNFKIVQIKIIGLASALAA